MVFWEKVLGKLSMPYISVFNKLNVSLSTSSAFVLTIVARHIQRCRLFITADHSFYHILLEYSNIE